MSLSHKTLCLIYGLIALLALVGTWGNNIEYLHMGLGFLGTNQRFWQDTLVNPASRSITVDIFFLGYAMLVWMVLEARRLRMRGVWLYALFGMLIAISVTFPVFMINRQRALAARDNPADGGVLSSSDAAILLACGLGFIVYTAITLTH